MGCRAGQSVEGASFGDVVPRLFLGLVVSGDDGLLAGLGALDGESAVSLADDAVGGFHSGSMTRLEGARHRNPTIPPSAR